MNTQIYKYESEVTQFDCLHCACEAQTFQENKLWENALPFGRFTGLMELLSTLLLEKINAICLIYFVKLESFVCSFV